MGLAAAGSSSQPPAARARPAIAPADTLVAGCSGGATAGGAGWAATGAGDLLRWSRSGPPGTPVLWRVVSHDSILARRLLGRLASTRFEQTTFSQPANRICSLATSGARAHQVAWPEGQRPPRIAAIVALFDDLRRAVERPGRLTP